MKLPTRMNDIRAVASSIFAILALAASAHADGTTDILVDPATGATISAPGSYRLVADATMTADVSGITITADNVTLDLGGHTLTGSPSGGSDGIYSDNLIEGVTVANGRIVGFGGRGFRLGINATVRDCRVVGNNRLGGSSGIEVGSKSTVQGCFVAENSPATGAAYGIVGGQSCRIIGNTISDNDSPAGFAIGIFVGDVSHILDNVIELSSGSSPSACVGIDTSSFSVIRDNVVRGISNLGSGSVYGIDAGTHSNIAGNICASNNSAGASATGIRGVNSLILDNTASFNMSTGDGSGVGISGLSRSVIRGNRCDTNSGAGTGLSNGIVVADGCRVEGNHCYGNTGGAQSHGIRVTSSRNLIAGNSTGGHSHGGIIFLNAASNRCRSNECDEGEVIESTAAAPFNAVQPSSVGTGDLVNVLF